MPTSLFLELAVSCASIVCMKGFFEEFKQFAIHGNALDLAVGVVIGAAFNQITTSLANNVLTPPIGLLFGGVNFSKLTIPLGGNAAISYGLFLQAILNFVIIALALFLLVKGLNHLTRERKEEEKKLEENPELKVLLEIRDSLRTRS